MLDAEGLEYRYREYTDEPLSIAELQAVFDKLGAGPRELLRKRDASALGLTGDEDDTELIRLMSEHPTLLQRPIGIKGDRAVLGRPVENLLELA